MATSTKPVQRIAREEYYASLEPLHAAPLWEALDRHTAPYPRSVPWVWAWRDLRPALLRAGEVVSEEEAERRVLMLVNPAEADRKAAVGQLYAGLQLILPGEVARAHRHSAAALRFVVEGQDAFTVVDGEPLPMSPGDLLLTPNWAWHDHVSESGGHVIWLDGLDSPLVRALDAWFFELHPEQRQPVTRPTGSSSDAFGQAGMLPPDHERPPDGASPLLRYPWSGMREALEQVLAGGADVAVREYTNPTTGGPVVPTLRCRAVAVRPGGRWAPGRRVGSQVLHVVEGEGTCRVSDRELAVGIKDVAAVPSWTDLEVTAVGSDGLRLFVFDDEPVLRALGLDRGEPAAVPAT